MEQWINELTFNSDINLQQLVSFSDNLKTQVSSSFAPGICPSPMNRKYIFVLYSIELYLFTHIVMYGAYTSKSRKSRFYKNCYSEKSDLKAYNTQSFCCSGQGIVKVGSKQRLPRFSNQTIHVIGQVRYLAKNFNPFKYYCPEHSKSEKPIIAWLWSGGKYVRCVIT